MGGEDKNHIVLNYQGASISLKDFKKVPSTWLKYGVSTDNALVPIAEVPSGKTLWVEVDIR